MAEMNARPMSAINACLMFRCCPSRDRGAGAHRVAGKNSSHGSSSVPEPGSRARNLNVDSSCLDTASSRLADARVTDEDVRMGAKGTRINVDGLRRRPH